MGPSERSDVLGSESIQTRLADEGIRPGKICLENASVLAASSEICLKPVARAFGEQADPPISGLLPLDPEIRIGRGWLAQFHGICLGRRKSLICVDHVTLLLFYKRLDTLGQVSLARRGS